METLRDEHSNLLEKSLSLSIQEARTTTFIPLSITDAPHAINHSPFSQD